MGNFKGCEGLSGGGGKLGRMASRHRYLRVWSRTLMWWFQYKNGNSMIVCFEFRLLLLMLTCIKFIQLVFKIIRKLWKNLPYNKDNFIYYRWILNEISIKLFNINLSRLGHLCSILIVMLVLITKLKVRTKQNSYDWREFNIIVIRSFCGSIWYIFDLI